MLLEDFYWCFYRISTEAFVWFILMLLKDFYWCFCRIFKISLKDFYWCFWWIFMMLLEDLYWCFWRISTDAFGGFLMRLLVGFYWCFWGISTDAFGGYLLMLFVLFKLWEEESDPDGEEDDHHAHHVHQDALALLRLVIGWAKHNMYLLRHNYLKTQLFEEYRDIFKY